MEVNILGCGSATPTRRHQPSCQVVEHRQRLFMVDCGEGAQGMFRQMGLKFSRLRHVFISHLHGDHLFGLPGLLSTMDLHGVEGVVTIHVHPEGARLLGDWMGYFLKGSQLELVYDIIQPGQTRVLYEDDGLRISTFPLSHRTACNGFRFDEKPGPRHIIADMVKFHEVPISQMKAIKAGADFVTADGVVIPNARLTSDPDPVSSYAYCSDTMPTRRVVDAVTGVTLLYHEATYDQSLSHQARERGHSTAHEAAEIALAAGVGELMIGHFSKRYDTEEKLLEEAREIFPRTILANEGMKVQV